VGLALTLATVKYSTLKVRSMRSIKLQVKRWTFVGLVLLMIVVSVSAQTVPCMAVPTIYFHGCQVQRTKNLDVVNINFEVRELPMDDTVKAETRIVGGSRIQEVSTYYSGPGSYVASIIYYPGFEKGTDYEIQFTVIVPNHSGHYYAQYASWRHRG